MVLVGRIAAAAIAGLLVLGVAGPESAPAQSRPVSTQSHTSWAGLPAGQTFAAGVALDGAIDHVVAISIDGLRADAIARLGEAGTPNIHRLIREGASTLNARNLFEVTVTLPNHAAMMTGQFIDRDAGGLGITFNHDNGETIHDTARREIESVFDVVHHAGGTTGLYVGKAKFDYFDRSWDDAITVYQRSSPSTATAALTAQLASADAFDFSFLHLPQPDSAGHASRWMSRSYLRAVVAADRLVGEVLAAIDASPARTADTAVILTTDHGGYRDGHSDVDRLVNYRIPFIVWGPDVAAGADLYELNPASRLDPGDSRPGYATVQPIRNGEVANLATDLLDLPVVPGSRFDQAHDLDVFAVG